MIDLEAHQDGAGVPAAGDQGAVDALGRLRLADVEALRVPLDRPGLDPLGGELIRAERDGLADRDCVVAGHGRRPNRIGLSRVMTISPAWFAMSWRKRTMP